MTAKTQIIEKLGERSLLLPSLINEAIAGNDRAKYLMSLLQSAREHADHPDSDFNNLRAERLATGIADSDLDAVVADAKRQDAGMYRFPRIQKIHDELMASVRQMLAPLQTTGALKESVETYEQRLQALKTSVPLEGQIEGTYIDRITSGQRDGQDSLHVLVMDLHKELNRLQQRIATDTVDGASVYDVRTEDRALIAAFMAGVNRTRPLKFDHPGLDTTATRSGGRVIFQNDIGATDAHVIVVHVEGLRTSVVYTDVHIERLVFFQHMLRKFDVQWEDTRFSPPSTLGEELFHLCRGTYTAPADAELLSYLKFLGSRLVFLIDWNRARKRLRKFARNRVCREVLEWAAESEVGHLGFLKLGGDQMLFDCLEFSVRVPLQPGRQLSEILGSQRVAEFLKFTLKKSTEGLLAGQAEPLLRDEIGSELRRFLNTAQQSLLEVAAEHAGLIVELAMAVHSGLMLAVPAGDQDALRRNFQQAKKWEHRADELVSRSRTSQVRRQEVKAIPELLHVADDVADALEEAAYLLTLLPCKGQADAPFGPIEHLARLLVQCAQEYLKAVENARILHRASPRQQVEDFLEAAAGAIAIEHQADDAQRQALETVLGWAGDFKQLYLLHQIIEKIEQATDVLMHAVHRLRDYVLGEMLTG